VAPARQLTSSASLKCKGCREIRLLLKLRRLVARGSLCSSRRKYLKIHNVGRAWRACSLPVQAIFLFSAIACANAQMKSFGERLLSAFAQDLRTPAYQPLAPDASPPLRRIPPAPFDSPPFPASDGRSEARRSSAIRATSRPGH
jgi:hypothetical protein